MKKPKRIRIQDFKSLGITQADLSKKTGVTQGNISKFIKTDRPIFIEVAGDEVRLIDCEPRIFGRIRKKAS